MHTICIWAPRDPESSCSDSRCSKNTIHKYTQRERPAFPRKKMIAKLCVAWAAETITKTLAPRQFRAAGSTRAVN
jgi:predicted DNA-binding transcriptional regulator AlpA